MSLLTVTEKGLYCERGGFFIDPWGEVETAILTHGHADHARRGSGVYLVARSSKELLRHRLGKDVKLSSLEYGEARKLGATWVSLHSAGHVRGSAQVRVESGDEILVVSGDYKRALDPTCEPFEPVPCDTFITEATFGLPIYRWKEGSEVASEIFHWWKSGGDRTSILFCYTFGKTQRVLAELARLTDRGVFLHGASHEITEIYRTQGVRMLPTIPVSSVEKTFDFRGDLIIAPPSAHRSPWMKRFKNPRTAFASGWMQVRGTRRRRGYEHGFVLSDHADWPSLIRTIRESGASHVLVSHGHTETLARYVREKLKIQADPLITPFEGEGGLG
jgi:putative mRNA 3-end processing factor